MSQPDAGAVTDRPQAEDRRRSILDAAVRVFARKGLHGARVSDIAAEAGVAHGLLYHYFRSKDEVLETVFRETWAAMLAAIAEVERAGEPAREQLRKLVAIVLRTWRRDPDLVRVLVREVTRSAHVEQEIEEIRAAFAAIERIVERGQESGELRRDLDARVASIVVYGALEEVLTGWVLGELPDGDEDVTTAERTVVELVTNGVAGREPSAA